MVLFDNIMRNPDKVGHGWQGFYFAENGEHTHADLAKHLGETLFALGAVETAEPLQLVTPEQMAGAKVCIHANGHSENG